MADKDNINLEDEVKDEEIVENEDGAVEAGNVSDESDTKEVSRKSKVRRGAIELIVYIALVILCVTFVPKYVVQRTIVDGDSMMNTLMNEENLIVEKVSYRFSDPKRFDVIVFYPNGRDSDDYYIKRVIGLPGETIQIKGNDIYINGKKLEEHFGKDPMTESGIAAEPLKLGDDEFFVLGDNREISEDSRYESVGPVKRKNIDGRAVLRIYPFSKFGTFK